MSKTTLPAIFDVFPLSLKRGVGVRVRDLLTLFKHPKVKYSEAKKFARELRKNQTKAEESLWRRVRNRRFYGYKFTRQFLIAHSQGGNYSYFIADFHCHEAKLIIEVDGQIHLKQRAYDEARTQILNELGYRVLRITNAVVIDDWEETDRLILEALKQCQS